MQKKTVFLALLMCFNIIKAQKEVEVADLTLKIGTKSEEFFYYAFNKGDIISFSFEETRGKELKEIEITAYPDNIKYQDYEVRKIKEKQFDVYKKGIYMFRFYNANSFKKRICKIKISRITDSNESANFNTGIRLVEQYDTTYTTKTENVVTGYHTIDKQKSRRVLASIDTSLVPIITNRVERIHAQTSLSNSNIERISIQLPQNIYTPNKLFPYKSTEVVSWAYVISVGNSGKIWYKDANNKANITTAIKGLAVAGLVTGGSGALAILAVEGVSTFSNPPEGDNIKYKIHTYNNGQPFVIDAGNSVATQGQVRRFTQGSFAIDLENDNIIDAIDVTVEILAVTITKTWKDEYYTVQVKKPIKEEQTKKTPKISVRKVPVMIEE